jgi:hypothetical protein
LRFYAGFLISIYGNLGSEALVVSGHWRYPLCLIALMKPTSLDDHQTLDAAFERIPPARPDRAGDTRRAAIAVLVVAALLACVEREIAGKFDGSMLSLVAQYLGNTFHSLTSLLTARAP